jgi:hypothetical protein
MTGIGRSWVRLTTAEWLAAAAVFVASAFIVQPLMAQQASRMALTAAIAEHGTVRIDRSEEALGLDFAKKDGHLYSDKAPAQPVLAVAPYLAYKAVGGESAEILRVRDNLGLWWISLWSAALPAAALVVVMSRLARSWSPRWSLPAALAMAFGSLLFPFGSLLFSHAASAALVAGGLLVWRRDPVERRDLLLAGALLGGALAVEYTAVVALAVVGLASLLRDRWAARWLAFGAAVPVAVVMGYHWIAFGGPFEVPYRYHNLGLHNSAAAGLTLPTAERLWTLATSEKGLFLLTPIVLVAVAGLVLAARERSEHRVELAVVTAVFLGFVVIQAGAADLTGGDSLGPRYVIPGLPALVIGVAVLWERAPRICAVTAGVSATIMVLATYTDPLLSVHETQVIRDWLDLLGDGDVVDTVLQPVMGRAGVAVLLAATFALAMAALHAHRDDRGSVATVPVEGEGPDQISRRRAARA